MNMKPTIIANDVILAFIKQLNIVDNVTGFFAFILDDIILDVLRILIIIVYELIIALLEKITSNYPQFILIIAKRSFIVLIFSIFFNIGFFIVLSVIKYKEI